MSIRLGINIDHVATLRNVRGGDFPSPIKAAQIVKHSGADQVTIHLREDRRHIRDQDAIDIINNVDIDINLEIACTDEMVNFAIKYRPDIVCLVPERREEITTEGGLNLKLESVREAIKKLKKNNLKICLFLDPDIHNIQMVKNLDIDSVELHTGRYSNLLSDEKVIELNVIKQSALLVKNYGLNCHAGHGLDYDNVLQIAKIKEISELNIGHSIISDSVFKGLDNSIKRMIKIINESIVH